MPEEAVPTKERLLDAGERLFAERGFDGVSIRDICEAADVNVAAVNYHFQGKQNLLVAVLERRLRPIRENALAAIAAVAGGEDHQPDLRELIRAFVTTYLQEALTRPNGVTFLKLMVREAVDPRHGGETFFRELVIPVHSAFHKALGRSLPQVSLDQLGWIIASIVGQVMHFVMRWRRGQIDDELVAGPRRVFPALAHPLDTYIRQVVDHVTTFSVGGIEALSAES